MGHAFEKLLAHKYDKIRTYYKKAAENLLRECRRGRDPSSKRWESGEGTRKTPGKEHSSWVLKEMWKFVPNNVGMVIPRRAISEQRHRGWEMTNMFDMLEGTMLGRQGGTRLRLMVTEHLERELLRNVSIKKGKFDEVPFSRVWRLLSPSSVQAAWNCVFHLLGETPCHTSVCCA